MNNEVGWALPTVMINWQCCDRRAHRKQLIWFHINGAHGAPYNINPFMVSPSVNSGESCRTIIPTISLFTINCYLFTVFVCRPA